jgi:hypothetical protein
MRLSALLVLVATPAALSLLACSSSTAKKTTDAAADPLALSDRPDKDVAGPEDAPAADSPASRDVPGPEIQQDGIPGSKDGLVADGIAMPDSPSIEAANRDGTAGETSSDVATDAKFSCRGLPTIPPPCNDDPRSAAVMGLCIDGVCQCNPGFALYPETGRCGYLRLDASVVDGPATAAVCTGTYDACQCMCCSTDKLNPTCYFPTVGETIDDIRTTYEASKDPRNCGAGSCSGTGLHYVCCMPATAEPSSRASYATAGNVGGIDHLGITKTGSDCASLSFFGGKSNNRSFNVDTNGIWAVSTGSFGSCADAGATKQIQGVLGTMTTRTAGSDCLADLHVTLFAIDDAGQITTARMDGDGIKLPAVLFNIACR